MKGDAMAEYGVIDLTAESPVQVEAGFGVDRSGFDLDHVRAQLEEIRDAILPVATGAQGSEASGFRHWRST
jgi:hypothetical protein